ncbi:MAG: c-type cytochrome [Bacteroidetes bacterium]|nr:c-type cytochrome [Bacteroidota bacterium]
MKHKIILITALALMSFSSAAFAQTATTTTQHQSDYNYLAAATIVGIAFMLFMVIYFGNIEGITAGAPKRAKAWSKLKDMLNRSVPIEKEKDIMMDHEFDGIKELDNTIPPWFNILFYGTIVISVVYMLNYHVFKINGLSAEEYNDEMKVATMQREELIRTGAFINENTVKLMQDEATLNEGKTIYSANCSACHGPAGGGLIGPNLTDDFWIHGGGIVNVFKTVKYGVPIKGMVSWQNQLNPKQLQAVSNYVLSLKGTNPPNAKQPEGDKYTDSTSVKTDSLKTGTQKADTTTKK